MIVLIVVGDMSPGGIDFLIVIGRGLNVSYSFQTVSFDKGVAGLSKSEDVGVSLVIVDDPLRRERPSSCAGHGHDQRDGRWGRFRPSGLMDWLAMIPR